MRAQFLLFQSHLDFAKGFWQKILFPGSIAVDATCGNGHDSLYLANLCLTPTSGSLHIFDIQKSAIDATQEKIDPTCKARLHVHHRCHSEIENALAGVKANLIVYNLGYLPGSDKMTTTMSDTTLISIQKALLCLADKGVISITCYPGHSEGKREEEELMRFCQTLDPKLWSVSSHGWLNRKAHPHLILIQRA